MKIVVYSAMLGLFVTQELSAQNPSSDTTNPKELKEVIIRAWQRRDIDRLPEEQNGFLNQGKKSEVVNLAGTNANIAIKTGRQVFSKVPGVFVYDMDGSGNQLNISSRGLDPHRSWEFNVRQNGVMLNSDIYAYPASHYSAPMESYERIELVRGTGSLQYGAQFGGMINSVTKKPDTSRIGFESINTAGSFGLLSTYNAIGGTLKKFSYYAYFHRRVSNGYRDNSRSEANAQFVQLNYQFNDRFSVRAQLGRSKYLYQTPGPLNDSMFAADPEMSTRARNYFSPDIYVPSINLNWIVSPATRINLLASGVFGDRSSVQFDAFANIPDAIDPATGTYKNRQVDIDHFNSKTLELRVLHDYSIGKSRNKMAAGIVYLNNDLNRQQLGNGTTGSDYDLTLVEPGFGRDMHFKTGNIALFVENAIQLNPRWILSPGLRYENGESNMTGVIRYYPANELPNTIDHNFLLAGISTQYVINRDNLFYAGISQAYRPVLFKDIVPASTYEQIDKDLENAKGYNAEIGVRGKLLSNLQYDISFFMLQYNNRMGTLVLQDASGQPYTYKTNIGDSRTEGVEIFVQYKFPISNKLYMGLFTSTSYMNALYLNGEIIDGTTNKSIKGNKVESVPEWQSRNGIEFMYENFSSTILYSYTSSTFSDALNTVTPPPSGARGFTPSYGTLDVNATWRIASLVTVKAGVNNLLNEQYFTKRPTMYPGPGIWPSDGINGYVTLGIKL